MSFLLLDTRVLQFLADMALFQVDGWNLSTEVKSGAGSQKKNKKTKKGKKSEKNKAHDVSLEKTSTDAPLKQNQNSDIRSKNFTKGNIIKRHSGEVTKNGTGQSESQPKKHKLSDRDSDERDPAIEEQQQPKLELDLPKTKLTPLQQKMMAKLTGSRFRWINETLYTITSEDALKLIKEQPSLFDEYHDGFRSQVQSWPENPVDVFVSQVKERSRKPVNAPGGLPGLQRSKKVVIADMGCGEAQFSLDISNFLKERSQPKKKVKSDSYRSNNNLDIEVHSFDLKKANERITVADIRHVPLENESCTIVIFCLALMGTNFLDFITEAYRILAPRGELWIAEIKSRFSDTTGEEFEKALKLYGFFHKKTDNENKMFTRFEFFKPPPDIIAERRAKLERKKKFIDHENEKDMLLSRREKTPEGKWLLKPCIYKRR